MAVIVVVVVVIVAVTVVVVVAVVNSVRPGDTVKSAWIVRITVVRAPCSVYSEIVAAVVVKTVVAKREKGIPLRHHTTPVVEDYTGESLHVYFHRGRPNLNCKSYARARII